MSCARDRQTEKERGLTDIFTPVFASWFISAELIRIENNGLGMRGCNAPLSTVDVFSQECARSPLFLSGQSATFHFNFTFCIFDVTKCQRIHYALTFCNIKYTKSTKVEWYDSW